MLFDLPDKDTLYQALLARDGCYDGRAFVGVTSTGVFCRLTCPARKSKPEHCVFFDTVQGCIQAGFRPCKRCHAHAPMAEGEPIVKNLIDALIEQPAKRWKESKALPNELKRL